MSAAHENKTKSHNPAQNPNPAAAPAAIAPAAAAAADRKDRRLGRGLSSLIPPNSAFAAAATAAATQPATAPETAPAVPAAAAVVAAPAPATAPHSHDAGPHGMLANIAPTAIEPNPRQPRRLFDDVSLRALADSIRANGLVQPIIIRRKRDGVAGVNASNPSNPAAPAFQLVAGERRWRAAQMAGLETMPAIIKHVAEDSLLELALTENLHRNDLNPIERATAYLELIKTRGWRQEQLADRLGENRVSVTNYLRLLELHEGVQAMLSTGKLSFGHAKAVLTLDKQPNQLVFAEAIVRYDWSVRQAEREVAPVAKIPDFEEPWTKMLAAQMAEDDAKAAGVAAPKPPADAPADPPRPAHIVALEEKLTRRLGTRVLIREGRREHMGKVVIDYYCLNDFDRILDALEIERD